jgi:hypothetical protein
MILYAAEGLSNAEIPRRLETAADVVGRWRKRFFEECLGLEDRERSGTPNDFASLDALAERLLRVGDHYRKIARPFDRTFTRADVDHLLTICTGFTRRLRMLRSRSACAYVLVVVEMAAVMLGSSLTLLFAMVGSLIRLARCRSRRPRER